MNAKSLESIICENVARYLRMASFTQSQLAERVGISTAFISRVERGQKMMKVHILLTAKIFGLLRLADRIFSASWKTINKMQDSRKRLSCSGM